LPWFLRSPDLDDIQRQMAVSLLCSLEAGLPVPLESYRAALQTGQNPESVFVDLGHNLAERFRHHQSQIEKLESQLFLSEQRTTWLNQENERLRKEPAGERLIQAQRQVRKLTADLQRAEEELCAMQQALEAEQRARRQEAAQREEYISAQNRIIAQQQLRLSSLTGETPDADTAGER
jgi:septal ring factor EnvC (AmiA/AmiB activator)